MSEHRPLDKNNDVQENSGAFRAADLLSREADVLLENRGQRPPSRQDGNQETLPALPITNEPKAGQGQRSGSTEQTTGNNPAAPSGHDRTASAKPGASGELTPTNGAPSPEVAPTANVPKPESGAHSQSSLAHVVNGQKSEAGNAPGTSQSPEGSLRHTQSGDNGTNTEASSNLPKPGTSRPSGSESALPESSPTQPPNAEKPLPSTIPNSPNADGSRPRTDNPQHTTPEPTNVQSPTGILGSIANVLKPGQSGQTVENTSPLPPTLQGLINEPKIPTPRHPAPGSPEDVALSPQGKPLNPVPAIEPMPHGGDLSPAQRIENRRPGLIPPAEPKGDGAPTQVPSTNLRGLDRPASSGSGGTDLTNNLANITSQAVGGVIKDLTPGSPNPVPSLGGGLHTHLQAPTPQDHLPPTTTQAPITLPREIPSSILPSLQNTTPGKVLSDIIDTPPSRRQSGPVDEPAPRPLLSNLPHDLDPRIDNKPIPNPLQQIIPDRPIQPGPLREFIEPKLEPRPILVPQLDLPRPIDLSRQPEPRPVDTRPIEPTRPTEPQPPRPVAEQPGRPADQPATRPADDNRPAPSVTTADGPAVRPVTQLQDIFDPNANQKPAVADNTNSSGTGPALDKSGALARGTNPAELIAILGSNAGKPVTPQDVLKAGDPVRLSDLLPAKPDVLLTDKLSGKTLGQELVPIGKLVPGEIVPGVKGLTGDPLSAGKPGDLPAAVKGLPGEMVPGGKPGDLPLSGKPGEVVPGSKGQPVDPLAPLVGKDGLPLDGKPVDRKDIIDKNTEKKEDEKPTDKELLEALLATRKGKKDGVKDTKQAEAKPDQKVDQKKFEQRKKYIVRPGDTVESIAEAQLGDQRFSVLICIINRSSISFRWEGAVRHADLRVGQTLWLPTPSEMNVHRSMFFSKKNETTSSNGASFDDVPTEAAAPATATQEFDEMKLPEVQFTENDSEDEQEKTVVSAKSAAVTAVLFALRRVGRSAVTLDLPLPQARTRSELLTKLADVAARAQEPDSLAQRPAVTSTPSSFTGVQKFAGTCRLMRVDQQNGGDFSTKLQLKVDKEWQTIASYESRDGQLVRTVWSKNGDTTESNLHLPKRIVQKMAQEDFGRYWQSYVAYYHDPAGTVLDTTVAAQV